MWVDGDSQMFALFWTFANIFRSGGAQCLERQLSDNHF